MTFARQVGSITGAGSGIGRATARLLAERGGTNIEANVRMGRPDPAHTMTASDAATVPAFCSRGKRASLSLARSRAGAGRGSAKAMRPSAGDLAA
jgi:NAD(P)-dependent dehydrogenase (short-subunit alcohol dehydrogenase family)